MGIDYSFNLAVGFKVSGESLEKAFNWTIAPSYHMEKRFDPKTGERVADEKVVDEEGGTELRFEGEVYDTTLELVEAICEKIGAGFWEVGSYMTGEMDYVIGPRLKKLPSEDVDSHITVGGGLRLEDFNGQLKEKVRAIGARLGKCGIFVDEPIVTIATCIS